MTGPAKKGHVGINYSIKQQDISWYIPHLHSTTCILQPINSLILAKSFGTKSYEWYKFEKVGKFYVPTCPDVAVLVTNFT